MAQALQTVNLDDKYEKEQGRVFITGTQALVRLCLLQRQIDLANGHNTGGFISGYRGSPIGAFDQQLWAIKDKLKEEHITFNPGVNEDLAATSIWGTQQVGLLDKETAKYDGVFGVWYGKGPGVDRTGDAFRHANLAGTSPLGGVLAIAGDDHTCKSSTTAHQSEFGFMDSMIPVLNPSSVGDFITLGAFGFALSRYSGCWVTLKCVAETIETTSSVNLDPSAYKFVTPKDHVLPPDGVNIRWPDMPTPQEERLILHKIPAIHAFVRANKIDKTLFEDHGKRGKLGIVTTGKSYLDLRQAFDSLGLSEAEVAELGIRVYHAALTYPMEPTGLKDFASSVDELLIVEEKRPLMEGQIKDILYSLSDNLRPTITGKKDEQGVDQFPINGDLSPTLIAEVMIKRLSSFVPVPKLSDKIARLRTREKRAAATVPAMNRIPYFCSGCPHSTGTKVPEGSRALAGIGCHFLSLFMDRQTATYTQMGGEGTPWIGQAPFTTEEHVFVNLGDGTYFHSGSLAIRASIAAKVNITYKILYNDAVAMTGGQKPDGELTVHGIVDQMLAEGAKAVAVVSDDIDKYALMPSLPSGVTLDHRDDYMEVQKRMRNVKGVSIVVYDQTCATEKRRRRKRGLMIDPPKRLFINPEVCEGCGDCGVQSNCVSITPVETALGRKRAIDQSSCNKDYSCANGFCPSFVTVKGGDLRRAEPSKLKEVPWEVLPEPELPSVEKPYGIYITGIGGTGVVTVGALLGMAAHLENKGVGILDMAGLAQKGGAVITHVRIGQRPEDIHVARIATADASLILGCDMVTAAAPDAISKMAEDQTAVVLNSQKTYTGDFTRNTEFHFPDKLMIEMVEGEVGKEATKVVDATRIATTLMGNSIATNSFMLGFAYQQGRIPVSDEAIFKAMEMNGVAVQMNQQAFLWGRRTAHNPEAVEKLLASQSKKPKAPVPESLSDIVEHRAAILQDYQNQDYADRYKSVVARVQTAEAKVAPGSDAFAKTVAENFFKLMAYKDEYEVARLHSSETFQAQLAAQFEGDYKVTFNLAPPLLSKRDPNTGQLKKREFGAWMMVVFKVLARMKGLRGTALDIFGYTDERKTERQLVENYDKGLDLLISKLTADNLPTAVEIAQLPQTIRGYGHIKEASIEQAKTVRTALLEKFNDPTTQKAAE